MSRNCPTCQSLLSPRSRFCPECGGAAPALEETVSLPSTLDRARAEASPAAGIQTRPSPIPPATVTRSTATAPAAVPPLAPAFIPSSRVGLPSDVEKNLRVVSSRDGDDCPLTVELNFHHLLVAGHATTLQARFVNGAVQPMENVQILFESRGLAAPVAFAKRRLGAGLRATELVALDPGRAGNFILNVSATWDFMGQRFSYLGQRSLQVLQAPNTGKVEINIGDIQANTGSGANRGLGAEYGDVNISNLLGSVKTLNDLIELLLPEKFMPVSFELDYQVTGPSSDFHKTLRIPPHLLTTVNPGALCTLEPVGGADCILPFRLVAGAEFRIGRSRTDAHFITWILPRSEANDERTMRISKVHARLLASGGEVRVKDSASANGVTLDGQKLDPMGTRLATRGRLSLGTEVEIDVARFDSSWGGEPRITNLRAWGGPDASPPLARGAVRCEVLAEGSQGLNSVWLLTDCAFGTSRSNPMVLDWANLAEVQGRFYHYRNCFWIENSSPTGLVKVEHHQLAPGEIVPLATGQQLQLGQHCFRLKIER